MKRLGFSIFFSFAIVLFVSNFVSADDLAPAMALHSDGRITMADGAPLSEYRADAATAAAYIKRSLQDKAKYDEYGEEAGYTYYGFCETARQLKRQHEELSKCSVAEVASLVWYAEFGYQTSGDLLWAGELPTDMDFKLQVSALNRLPAFKGRVFRFDFYTEAGGKDFEAKVMKRMAVYQKHLEQKTPFVFRGFLSSTRGEGEQIQEAFEKKGAVILEIKSKGGVSIEKLSSRPYEQEVLFLPGTSFSVDEITVQPASVSYGNPLGKSYRVRLTEL